MILRLVRRDYGLEATRGELVAGGERFATLEDPWQGNAVGRSCIPEGVYLLRPRRYHRGGYDTLEVCDVPGRSLILLHRGNTARDTEGCVLLGERHGTLAGAPAVLDSGDAWRRFVRLVDVHREHVLDVRAQPAAGAPGVLEVRHA